MDFRTRPIEDWGFLLVEIRPRPIDGGLGWTQEEASAVFCAIVTIRTIIRYTDKSIVNKKNAMESIQAWEEAEKKNILLRYAWLETSPGIEKFMGINEGDPVLQLQKQLYKELMDPLGDWASSFSNGVTFESIMESQPMLEHFWSRPEFQLWTGIEAREEDDGSMVPQHVLRGTTPVPRASLAEQSLVRWSSNEIYLSEHLMSIPDPLNREGIARHVQRWSMGRCACIRVLYDPGSNRDGPGYEHLSGLEIAPMILRHGPDGSRWAPGRTLGYRLAAVVRLGSPETCDKVGLVTSRAALSLSQFSCDSAWTLGQCGFKYMLYYIFAEGTDLANGTDLDAELRKKAGLARAAKLQAGPSTGAASGNICSLPPASAPSPPRAQEEPLAVRAGHQRGNVPGHQLTSSNSVPLGPSRLGRSSESSQPGPSGQQSGADRATPPSERTRGIMTDKPRVPSSASTDASVSSLGKRRRDDKQSDP